MSRLQFVEKLPISHASPNFVNWAADRCYAPARQTGARQVARRNLSGWASSRGLAPNPAACAAGAKGLGPLEARQRLLSLDSAGDSLSGPAAQARSPFALQGSGVWATLLPARGSGFRMLRR